MMEVKKKNIERIHLLFQCSMIYILPCHRCNFSYSSLKGQHDNFFNSNFLLLIGGTVMSRFVYIALYKHLR